MLFLFSILVLVFIFIVIVYSLLAMGLMQPALYFSYGFLFFTIFLYLLLLVEAYRVIFLGRAPYVRSGRKLLSKLMKEIAFKENSLVFDLGCGDGVFLRELVKKNKVRAIGYEYSLIPYVLALVYNLLTRSKMKIVLGDFIKADISNADYVFCFLMGSEMIRLEEKVRKELKPGAMVISNTFKFKDWQPEKIITLNEKKESGLSNRLYIYRK